MLKGPCQEIFDLRIFDQSIPLRPLIHALKYFRISVRIRGDIREYVLIIHYAALRKIILCARRIINSHSQISLRIRKEIRKYFRARIRGLGGVGID
jgi:hypothetical protein